MNVSATLNFLRLIGRPSLCLPHTTISNFNDLPVPLSDAFGPLKPDIRAVVLDKDNCFAVPKENVVYKPYAEKFHALLTAYPTPHLLIVSNSAGTTTSDPASTHARLLSANTGVPVLHHSTKKPGCGPQILAHFRDAPGSRVTAASQIAVVGDRLFTDVMTANLMGSWAVWVRDGVVGSRNPVGLGFPPGESTLICRRVESPRALLKILHAGKGMKSSGEELYPKLVY
ncbi:MAG: hypothetical protein LQ348_001209 [Seirophora lacunosa]|nr:MAG: hypothetical protein LQ348_001209 [Seirophora lacunosa]